MTDPSDSPTTVPQAPMLQGPSILSSHGVEAALASVAEHVRGLRRNVVEYDVDALAEHAFACETLSLGLLARLETRLS